MDSVYADLPVLIVADWSDITEALLDKTYEEFHGRSDWAFERLYKGYWYNKFRSFGYPPTKYLA